MNDVQTKRTDKYGSVDFKSKKNELKFNNPEYDEGFINYYRTEIKSNSNEKQVSLSDYISSEPKPKQKYTQDWSSYDKAKTNETIWFKQLLNELVFLANIDNNNSIGRKGFSIKDKIVSMCTKVYYQSSLRKTESELKELKRLGYIDKVPCYKSVDNFFNDIELAPILDILIAMTTQPLISFEKVGAIDSSGFGLRKYDEWNEYKWGKYKGKEKVWRKAHIIVGTKTNIVFTVGLTQKNVSDCSVFTTLLDKAVKHIQIQEICADKAYLSRENMGFAYNLGIMPYIPFKVNTSGKARGSHIWKQMYEYFKHYEEQFMEHYHQRSNVESNFHMLKSKFGSNLTTKSFQANGVEMKIKVLCHNICVLIEESIKLGFEINFDDCVKMMENVKNNQ